MYWQFSQKPKGGRLGKAKVIHFGFDDPAKAEGSHEEKLSVFRRVRGEIKTFIETLPDFLNTI